jgi:hypothetical protein
MKNSIEAFFYISRKKSVLDQLFELLFSVLYILTKLLSAAGGLAFPELILVLMKFH